MVLSQPTLSDKTANADLLPGAGEGRCPFNPHNPNPGGWPWLTNLVAGS